MVDFHTRTVSELVSPSLLTHPLHRLRPQATGSADHNLDQSLETRDNVILDYTRMLPTLMTSDVPYSLTHSVPENRVLCETSRVATWIDEFLAAHAKPSSAESRA